jgi:hypothetical protein
MDLATIVIFEGMTYFAKFLATAGPSDFDYSKAVAENANHPLSDSEKAAIVSKAKDGMDKLESRFMILPFPLDFCYVAYFMAKAYLRLGASSRYVKNYESYAE